MSNGSIYNTLSLIIYVSLFIGLHPNYIVTRGRRKVLKTNKYCNLIILFYGVIFTILLYFASLDETPNPVTNGKIYNFNTLAKLLILVVSMVGSLTLYGILLLSYLNKKSFRDFVNTIAAIDETLTKLGYNINHQLDFNVSLAITLIGPFFTLSNITMELWNISREDIDPIPEVVILSHVIPFMLIHQGETQFVVANVILRHRFAEFFRNFMKKVVRINPKIMEKIVVFWMVSFSITFFH